MKTIKDVEYSSANQKCKFDMYLPEGAGFKTIIWFHGGGLENGDKADGEKLAPDFVDAGYAFLSVNYRLYPEGAKFPEYLEDAAAAVAYIKRNISAYGGNESEIYVSGQSAGAWLSLMLCFDEKYLNAVGVENQDIAGWLIDSAQTISHFNVIRYELGLDSRAQRINEFAPLYFVSEKSAFSKILLIFYDNDMPCRYEQNMLFYKAVLFFNEAADIKYKVLSGGHCQGSSVKDPDGKFGFTKASLEWLKG